MSMPAIDVDRVVQQLDALPAGQIAGRDMHAPRQHDSADISDDALALALSAQRFRGNWVYVAAWSQWYVYNPATGLWQLDNTLRNLTLTREFLRTLAADASTRDAPTLQSAKKVSAVVQMARSNPEVAATANQWNRNVWVVGTPGGAVDLHTGRLRGAHREDYLTRSTAVTPAETADCPKWQAFLHRIFPDQPHVIEFMQRLAGYAATGSTREHKLFFCWGGGRNGKGVFMNTLSWLLGDYATAAPGSLFLEKAVDSHPTELAGLDGARLLTASEIQSGGRWDEVRLKGLTGGDPITARHMRQDFYTYDPQFTIILAANHRPSFRTIDEATRARIVLVPFLECIPPDERDPDLTAKLREEGPAILRWIIDGAVKWQQSGLCIPESILDASAEYLEDEDQLGQFITECLRSVSAHSLPVRYLYDKYREWASDQGLSRPWTKKALSSALKERGHEIRHTRNGRVLDGYTLRP